MTPEAQAMPDHVWVLESADENVPCEFVADRLRQIFTRPDQAEHFTRTSTIAAQLKTADDLAEALAYYATKPEERARVYGDKNPPSAIAALANYASVRKESK